MIQKLMADLNCAPYSHSFRRIMAERCDPEDDHTKDEEVHGPHLEQRNKVKIVVHRCANSKENGNHPESATPMRANFFMAGSKLRPPTGAQQALREGYDFTSASWSRRRRPRFTAACLVTRA